MMLRFGKYLTLLAAIPVASASGVLRKELPEGNIPDRKLTRGLAACDSYGAYCHEALAACSCHEDWKNNGERVQCLIQNYNCGQAEKGCFIKQFGHDDYCVLTGCDIEVYCHLADHNCPYSNFSNKGEYMDCLLTEYDAAGCDPDTKGCYIGQKASGRCDPVDGNPSCCGDGYYCGY